MHGVPGLTHAARSGNVVLVNALGCSLLESPAVIPFLPTLARYLPARRSAAAVGADLVVRRRRGPAATCSTISTQLVIKPSFPRPGAGPIYGARLVATSERELRDRGSWPQPQNYVAQELVAGSTAPAWNGGAIAADATSPCARSPSPPATTTTSCPAAWPASRRSPDALGESALGGHGSKDVWVLSDGPCRSVTLLHPAGHAGRPAAQRQRPAQPRRRSPVLARPARGADGRGRRDSCGASSRG